MTGRIISYCTFSSLCMLYTGCREPFEIESIEFQDSLVVEATITNELKRHIIKVSRTYELNQGDPVFVNDAEVFITAGTSNMISFASVGDGIYQSDNTFEADPNVEYQLFINTSQGDGYQSLPVFLTPISDITSLYAEFTTNNSGEEGIQILVDSDNQATDARYFRYEYEETYKLVAPYWYPYKPILVNPDTGNTTLVDYYPTFDALYILRPEEERTCYTTQKQNGILQTSTNGLSNNIISKFPVRFINKNDGIIRDRYSILVQQYVQSAEAYSYYKILKDLGNSESILSQNQPGFPYGNIVSVANPDETVIGYFDVSSVSEERIYFNYFDFNLTPPEYLYECEVIELDYNDTSTTDGDKNERYEIFRLLTTFAEYNQNYELFEIPVPSPDGIWKIVRPECGDCTSVSSNIRPDFWQD